MNAQLFISGFGGKKRHRKQLPPTMRGMQKLQYPYLTWVCGIALILDAGS